MNIPKNKIRRIVTGHSKKGEAIIVSDRIVENISLGGGKNFMQLWGNDSVPIHPDNGIMCKQMDWFPKPGGHRFYIWVLPPRSQKNDDQKSKSQIEKLVPGFMDYFESEDPGMHTTDTVDCTYLISGSAYLELDKEQEVLVKEGDSVVQNGTRHRWHNREKIPAVFVTTCIGSERKATNKT